MNVYRTFINNLQKLETTQRSLNQGMDKQTLVHPYNGIRLSNIMQQTTDTKHG